MTFLLPGISLAQIATCPPIPPPITLCDTEQHTYYYDANKPLYDFTVPAGVLSLDILLIGADGGSMSGDCGEVPGGKGGEVHLRLFVDNSGGSADLLQPNGILRVTPGEAGHSRNIPAPCFEASAGGSGSTGLMYLCPGCSPINGWRLIAVAGGGGGASASGVFEDYPGRAAYLHNAPGNDGSAGPKGTVEFFQTGGGGVFNYTNTGEGGVGAVESGTLDSLLICGYMNVTPRCYGPGSTLNQDSTTIDPGYGGNGWSGGGRSAPNSYGGGGGGFTGGSGGISTEQSGEGGYNWYNQCIGAQLINEVGVHPDSTPANLTGQGENGSFIMAWTDGDPLPNCLNDTLELDANGLATADPAEIGFGSYDYCEIASMTLSDSVFTCDDIGDNIVTLSVTDSSGYSATCSATVLIQPFSGSMQAQSLRFLPPAQPGTPASIEVDAGTIDPGNMTVEMWVRISQWSTGAMRLIGQGDYTTDQGFHMSIDYDRVRFLNNNNSTGYEFMHGFSLDTWYHIAAVGSGQNTTIYVDGVSLGTQNTGPKVPSSSTLLWGRWSGGNANPLNGNLDDLRLWTTQRTGDQINAYMNQELLGWEDNLRVYFPLNDGTFGYGSPLETLTIASNAAIDGNDGNLTNCEFAYCGPGWSIDSPGLSRMAGIRIDTSGGQPSEDGNVPGVYQLRVSTPNSAALNFNISKSGTASYGNDYDNFPGSVSLPGGTRQVAFSFNTVDDTLFEYPETVVATLGPSGDYQPDTAYTNATHTILSDELAEVSVHASDSLCYEQIPNFGEFVIELSEPIPFNINLDLSLTGSATNGIDYVNSFNLPVDTTITIPANTTIYTIPIEHDFNPDTLVEGTETVVLEVITDGIDAPVIKSSNPAYTRDTVYIIDMDEAHLSVGSPGIGVLEDSGDTTVLTLDLDMRCQYPVTVDVSLAGTAQSDVDYTTALGAQVVIPPYSKKVEIEFYPLADTIVEQNEIVQLQANAIYGIGSIALANPNYPGEVSIIEDDSAAIVILNPALDSVDEGAASNFEVVLSKPSASPTTIFYSLTGKAINGGDYQYVPNSISIEPGNTTGGQNIITINDTEVEGFEDVVITLTAISGNPRFTLGSDVKDTIIIRDDDVCLSQGGTVIYVAASGDDTDGQSWTTALHSLQEAINAALSCTEEGSVPQIWVASGTHFPAADASGNSTPADPRNKTFYIDGNVAIYGGFVGTETQLYQRDTSNTTILSGDIDMSGTAADNAYHVVTINGDTSDVSNLCILDGFTITGGSADNVKGGGVYCKNASPLIRSCNIIHNTASSGGGVYMENQNGPTRPRVERCQIIGNEAFEGGGIYFGGDYITPLVVNCRFDLNNAGEGGGAYNNGDFGDECNADYFNCVFTRNTADFGGGMENRGFAGKCVTDLVNCTFAANAAFDVGGAIDQYNQQSPFDSEFKNCIFWGNTDANNAQISNFEANPLISYCIVQNSGGSDNWPVDGPGGFGIGTDGGNNLDISPQFTDSINGDFTLTLGSPAINAGLDSVNNTIIDAGGNLRFVGAGIDIGSYEYGRYTYIPDDAFEQALIDQGIDSEGILNDSVLTADISSILYLNVAGLGIQDMTGIQSFQALEILECHNNSMDSLDLSANHNLFNLVALGNNSLSFLDVSSTLLTSVDLYSLSSLSIFHCANTFIAGLDLSANTALVDVNINNNVNLSYLDLRNGNNVILTSMSATATPSLTCIEVDDPESASLGLGSYSSWVLDLESSFAGGINVWTGGPGNWSDTDKWSRGRPPLPCENVIINATGAGDTILIPSANEIDILDMNVQSGRLQIDPGALLRMWND